jgi:2-phosphosulfolactate phosphatase
MAEPPIPDAFRVGLEWGVAGARASRAGVAVVVDVLSFSTSVCIAVERGMHVHPYAWKGTGAEEFASRHHAVLAVGRLEATVDGAPAVPSLSPAGLLVCPPVPRLVLPSPNGSTIAATLQDAGATVLVGCLRNAAAVAERLATELDRGASVVVIAAGERWGGDGSLRPALEDQLGAGAVLSALASLGYGAAMSPEASSAAGLFQAAGSRLREWLTHCVSGRELIDRGFDSDVEVASALDVSRTVPALSGGWFCGDCS